MGRTLRQSHACASDIFCRPSASDADLLVRPTGMPERPIEGPRSVTPTDVLSDVLRAVRLKGAVFFDFEATSPWVVEAPPSRDVATRVIPGAQRVIEYHLVAQGSCWGGAIGEPPIRLRQGDLIVFPQGDPHVLSSAPGMRTPADMSLFDQLPQCRPLSFKLGGGGPERARIVCCFLGLDERPFNPLLAALPRVIHLSADNPESSGWLGTLHDIAARESATPRPGSDNVLSRLAELMFVGAVRGYIETLPAAQNGWLAGLRDPLIGQALAALHSEPTEAWTVDRLARCVAMSRSMLADRFTSMVGQPPMQYLTMWRMQLASGLLSTGCRIAEVAPSVGYDSEAAFSRAFKKVMGTSPAAWRKTRLLTPAAN
jgi:AraC-like DNA-binding protein